MKFLLGLASSFLMVVVLSSCGSNDSTTTRSVAPAAQEPLVAQVILGTPVAAPTVPPLTSFAQTVANNDLDVNGNGPSNSFPGQANVWDINSGFSLDDGGDDQFDGALELTVGTTNFLYDQSYGELTFYTPVMGAAQGVLVAAVSDGTSLSQAPLAGTYSAYLNATSDSRLQQTLNLTTATAPVTLTWTDAANLSGGSISGYTPSYRVVVRNSTGIELEQLTLDTPGANSKDLSAYVGQTIILSFELRNQPQAWSLHSAVIDAVSVLDGAAAQYVTNGDFETGNLTGWTSSIPAQLQNMTAGVRTLEGLDVRRSFYTVPNKLWGRWVDLFENNTAAPITTTVRYSTNLGSDGSGIIYATPGTANKALTSWDGDAYDRDIGLVFGSSTNVTFTSDDGLGNNNGSDYIYVDYNITVPAGGRIAIVNFIIMDGTDTGQTATNISAKATEIDLEAAKIVTNFRTDTQYRDGMTQQQIDAILNF